MIRTAGRNIIALFILLSFFVSCKKDSERNDYIKLKIDGSWITWKKVSGHLVVNGADGKSGFELLSYKDDNSESFHFGISIDNKTFPTGTYTPDNSFSLVSFTKKPNTPDFIEYTGGGIMGGSDTRYDITISSITDKEVRGSFKGSFLRNIADDNDLIKITEGEFVTSVIR